MSETDKQFSEEQKKSDFEAKQAAADAKQTKDSWPTETVPYSELLKIYQTSGKKIPFKRWCEERQACRQDLLYLGINVLGKLFTARTHGPIAEFFIKKDFSSLPVGYTRRDVIRVMGAQSEIPWRMLHYPRGSYKSTIDVVDVLQWILCCPDLRILILTGEKSLAVSFVGELKQYCTIREGGHRTYFQQLFPEYCGSEGDLGNSLEFICPARKLDNRESTVWANSVMANLSGWHCDLIKADDVVTDENSETEDRRDKLYTKFMLATELLDPHGYLDLIGTRYSLDDLYGELLKPKDDDHEIKPISYLMKPAWTPLPGFETVPLRDLQQHMVELLFPEVLTWSKLRQKLVRNERQFRCQQLNKPIEELECSFNEDMLRKATIPVMTIPDKGRMVNVWDTAVNTTSKNDFTVGVAAILSDGKMYVRQIVWDRFKPSEKAYQIVKMARETMPEAIAIENAQGIENLQPEIQRVALQYKVAMPIRFFPPKNTYNAGGERIAPLEILITGGRLFFSSAITCLEEMYSQFVRFTGKKTGKKDDIIDAISFLQRYMPGPENNEWVELDKKEQEEKDKTAKEKAIYESIFGPLTPIPTPEPDKPALSERDLNAIFGGNGMHV